MSPLKPPQVTINPQERLSAESAQRILAELPAWVVAAIADRAAEIEYPVEAVVEMAFTKCLCKRIASFLDDEAIGFSDCLQGQRLQDNV
jgi:hypothetical protein